MTIVGGGGGKFSDCNLKSCSSVFLQTPELSGLFDAGYGTLSRLRDLGINPTQIDAIWLTHLHFDHASDLGVLAGARRMIAKRDEINLLPLRIYGPRGMSDAFIGGMKLVGIPDFDMNSVEIIEITNDRFDDGTVISVPVRHFPGMPSLAYYVRVGNSGVVYTGDFGRNKYNFDQLSSLPHKAQLLLCEASGNHRGHIGTDTALEIWKQREDLMLGLVHLRTEEIIAAQTAARTHNGSVFIAADGMKIMV